MAFFDLFSQRRSVPGPWDKRPAPDWHRRGGRPRGFAERFALVLGFFVLGAGIAAAAMNYHRMPEFAAYLRGEPAVVSAEPRHLPEPRPSPRSAAPVERFTAIDGDSLRNGSGDVRLVGIDAPELNQTCRRASGQSWNCGREAHQRLRALVSRGVHCRPEGRDRYGRTLARCYADGHDVGEAMVREGLALDFMGGGYAGVEADARRARRGVWAGDFELPQQHRRNGPRAAR